jgi:hypothetical protein
MINETHAPINDTKKHSRSPNRVTPAEIVVEVLGGVCFATVCILLLISGAFVKKSHMQRMMQKFPGGAAIVSGVSCTDCCKKRRFLRWRVANDVQEYEMQTDVESSASSTDLGQRQQQARTLLDDDDDQSQFQRGGLTAADAAAGGGVSDEEKELDRLVIQSLKEAAETAAAGAGGSGDGN